MANKKISSFTEITEAPDSADVLPIVDVSDTTGAPTGTTKKVSLTNLSAGIVDISTSQLDAASLVTESEGISSNDNDTTLPTSAAVKDYVDTQILTKDNLDEIAEGTTNKHFTATDETKLDGIEDSADVTDTANVTAAGALMDSELTDLAGVKGVTISTLQEKPSEGAFVDGDKTKLDGIATAATANDSDANLKNRANHTGTQAASTISDFDTEVANNSAVTANTAKETNASHTGDVTGSTALTIASDAVTTAKIADDAVTGAKLNAALNDLSNVNASPTDGQVLKWVNASSEWQAADDGGGSSGGATFYVQNFSGTGSATQFTLSQTPASENNTQVYISGVYQQKDTYSLSGTTLTFSEAPSSGTDNIEVVTASTSSIGSTTSDLVTFSPSGTGATNRTTQAKLRDLISVKDFGAVGDGTTDDSDAFQDALDISNAHVFVPSGTYRLDTMLEMGQRKTLELAGGAILQRGGTSTDPVIWMKGNYSTIMGAGQSTSVIENTNDSPKGVILVGQWSMSVSPNDVLYNTIRNVDVSGSTAYGQTSGDPDSCILIQAPQLEAPYSPADKAVYFTNISGVRVQKSNYGIWLRGWANGNTISDIQGYKLGDDNLGEGALFYDNGSLDNSIANAFLHNSPDSVGIKLAKLDNTSASGGREFTTEYSSYVNITTEQTGTSAKGILSTDGETQKCFFSVRSNCNAGNDLDSGFKTRNTLISNQSVNEIAAEAVLTPKKFAWVNDDDTSARVFERGWRLTGLSENTQYKLLTVDTDSNSTNHLVELTIADAWASGITPKQAERALFAIKRNGSGTITVEILEHSKMANSPTSGGLTVPTVDGDDVIFSWKVLNNGTGTTSSNVTVKACVLGGSDDVVYHQTATTSSSTESVIQGADQKRYFDNQVLAATDNTHSLGASSNRWSEVFSGTGTINTSDEREKQQIDTLSSAEMNVAVAVKGLIKKFKFNSAVGAKGDGARIHVGFVAQEVEAAFSAEGLDAADYGLFCRDVWHEKDGDVCDPNEEGAVERERLGVRADELLAFVISAM